MQCRECDGTGERCSTAYLIQEYFEGNEAFSSFNVSTTDVQDENGKNVVFSKFKFKEDEVLFDLTFDGHEAAFNELPIVQSEKDNVLRDAYDKLCQKIGIGNNVKVLQQRVWLAKCFRAIEYKYECDGQEYVCYINPNTWEVVEAPGKDLISHYAAKYQQLGELADNKGNWIGAFQNYIQAFGMQCAIHRSTDFKMGETYLKALDRTRKKTLIASLLFLIIGYLAGVALFYFSPDKDLLIINDWGEITVVNLIIWILNGIISFIFARKFFVNGNGIRIAGGKLVLFIIGILHGFAWAPRDYVSGNFFGGDKQLLICFIEIILYPVLMLLPIVFTGFALTQKQSSLAERTKKVKESFDKALKSGTIAKLAKSYRTSYFLTIYMLFAGIFCIAFLTLLSQPFTSPKDRLHNVTEILEKQGSQSERFKTFEVMLDRDLNKLLESKYAPVYVVYATALANGCQYVDKDPQKALEILKQGCELNDEPSKKMMLELTAQRDTSDKVKALEEEIQTALAAGGEANYQKALELAAQMEPLDTKAAGKWRNKAKETKLTKTAQDAANAKDWAKAREDATEAFALNADNAVAAEIMATAEANLPVTDGMLYLSGVPLKMIKVHAGSFLMGSPNDELGRDDPSSFFKGTIWEDPEKQHRVTLTQDYWLGETEVTQEQWKAVMENNRSRNKGNQNPVENVSRSDAMDFCNKLNEKYSGKLPAGYKFSLPSEAQWEYACRAGTTTSLNSGKNITTIEKGAACSNLDEVGWYCQNTDSTQPVGKKKPNAWGFYDMHGNVNEWCSDLKKSGSNVYAINRGGSYKSSPLYCRSASYDIGGPDTRKEYDGFYGFRLALVPIQ